MEDDYGLGEIKAAYDVIIVDTSAGSGPNVVMSHSDYERIKRAVGRFSAASLDAQIRYSSLLLQLFKETEKFVITEKLAEEYRRFGISRSDCKSPRKNHQYRLLLERIHNFAPRRRVLSLREEESDAYKQMRDFFWYETVNISETDFDMLMMGLAVATYRGDTAILSNDVELLRSHRRVADNINSPAFLQAGLGQVKNMFAFYSMFEGEKFHLTSVFRSGRK